MSRATSFRRWGDVVLVTGAMGQVGRDLLPELRRRWRVVASDVASPGLFRFSPASHSSIMMPDGKALDYVKLDVLDKEELMHVVKEFRVNRFVHLASLLSAIGEKFPLKAHQVNIQGTLNILEAAKAVKRNEIISTRSLVAQTDDAPVHVFAPSTIAVFGPDTPRDNTPDEVYCNPTTMYGISKVHLEGLGCYYRERHGIDFRSLRYPGVISHTVPGGGTTDYAIEMYQQAVAGGRCSSFIARDTTMPFMYMPDCLRSTMELMGADRQKLSRSVYNVTGVSFTPEQVFASIKRRMPECEVEYKPDFREEIAQSWPRSIDDSNARRDWGWKHAFDLDAMTDDILAKLEEEKRAEEEKTTD